MTDYDSLHQQGLADRGDLLGDEWIEPGPAAPVLPPRLEGQPEFPTPGIYFGMPEAVYHAIHACSTSGLKNLSVSSMDYWANSVLNPDRDDERTQKDYFDFGHAIHTLVLEGEEVYAARYVIGLEKPKGALETTDEIKAAIIANGGKPTTKGYDDLTRSAKKQDWIDQLADLDPEAVVWDTLKTAFEAEHAGAEVISAKIDRRVRIAAKMILSHPQIAAYVRQGYPEVSVFWFCPITGCPMKARFDYLKLEVIVDLKSFSNRGGMPINRATERAIASGRYNVQHVVYDEAAAMAKKMICERGADAIFTPDDVGYAEQHEFCERWAMNDGPPEFMFIFQQTGIAPVTRGRKMPRESMGVFGATQGEVLKLKRIFIANCDVYGTDPWLDIVPIDTIEDEAIPMWATDLTPMN